MSRRISRTSSLFTLALLTVFTIAPHTWLTGVFHVETANAAQICPQNLVKGGGAEDLVVTKQIKWVLTQAGVEDSYRTTQLYPYWNPKQPNTGYQVEVWRGLMTPVLEGKQNFEFDYPGRSFSQNIATAPGATYRLSFLYAPRPGSGFNQLAIEWNGQQIASVSGTAAANTALAWQSHAYYVTASSAMSVVGFRSIVGTGAGNLADDIQLHLYADNCNPPPPSNADLAGKISLPPQSNRADPLPEFIGAKNEGSTTVSSAVLTQQLPSGFSFLSSPGPCSGNSTTVTCNVPALSPGQFVNYLVYLQIAPNFACGTTLYLSNTVTTNSATDGNPGNNKADASTLVTCAGGVPAQCSDGGDNDGDGLIDYPQDPGCANALDNDESNAPVNAQCSDGIDNDNDGATDYPNDFSCSSGSDNDETFPKALCQDGQDNDQDGLIDWPQDPGCSSRQDNDEFNAVVSCTRSDPRIVSLEQNFGLMNAPLGTANLPNGGKLLVWNKILGLSSRSNFIGQTTGSNGIRHLSLQTTSTVPHSILRSTVQSLTNNYIGAFLGEACSNAVLNEYVANNWKVANDAFGCSAPYLSSIENHPEGEAKNGVNDNPGDAWLPAVTCDGSPPPTPQCQDGFDNDGDGKADSFDPGCHSDGNPYNSSSYIPSDNDESSPATVACNDGFDNDSDGKIDFQDPGCHTDGNASNPNSYNPLGNSEQDATPMADVILTLSVTDQIEPQLDPDLLVRSVVQNLGPVAIPGALLTLPIPAGLVFNPSLTTPVGACTATTTTVTCVVPPLTPAQSQTFLVYFLVPASQPCQSTLTVNGTVTPVGFVDGNPGNNNASASTLVTCPSTPPQCNDSVDNDGDGLNNFPADPGCSSAQDNDEANSSGLTGDMSAKITLPPQADRNAPLPTFIGGKNEGSTTIPSATLKVPLAAGFALLDPRGSPCSVDINNVITCTVPALGPGASVNYLVDLKIANTFNCGSMLTLNNTATPSGITDTNPDNNIASAETRVTCAGGTPPPQCSDNVDNDGDGKADAQDPGCHSDGNESNAASYVPSDTDETDASTPAADIEGKITLPPQASRKDPLPEFLGAKNVGATVIPSSTLTQSLPTGFVFLSAPGSPCSASSSTVTCSVPALNPGDSVSYLVYLQIPADHACSTNRSLQNVATPNGVTEGNTINNTATVSTFVTCP